MPLGLGHVAGRCRCLQALSALYARVSYKDAGPGFGAKTNKKTHYVETPEGPGPGYLLNVHSY